jgi:DNA-binding response OmpR family regulator
MQGINNMKTENQKKRILAIEDEPIINLITVRVLRAEGFEVDVADNGTTAKAMAQNTCYHLYLCDIRTPAMNGMEFYQYLREIHPGHEKRIIFTTGDTLNQEIKTFLGARNNLFLAKPFTPEELRSVIKKA